MTIIFSTIFVVCSSCFSRFLFNFDLSQVQYKRAKRKPQVWMKKKKEFFFLFGFHFIAGEKKT